MKRVILALLLLLVIPICSGYESEVNLALDNYVYTPNLQPVVLKYEPYPVNPGEYVDVWIKFENDESEDIDDLTIEFVPQFPFSIDSSETITRHFGKVLAHSSVVVKYRVRVSEDAIEGDRYFRYRYRYVQSDLKWVEAIEKIRVQTREAVLSVSSVESNPDKIIPGQEARVTIKLKNDASSVIRDIAFYLDLTMSTVGANSIAGTTTSTVIDSYYNAIPLAPVSSSTEKRITHLKPGEEVSIVYDLIAFPDAESKIYKVPVIMRYQDEIGMNYTKHDIVGLVVGADPDLDIKIEDNTIYGKTTGDISVMIVNKGVSDVKFMNVELRDSDAYDIISNNKAYIGDVDSDDYETADFTIKVNKLEDNKILTVPIRVDYKDANNKDFSKDLALKITAYSEKERGMNGGSSLGTIIFVLIICVAGWFIYRRWEKKKKAKKEKK